MQLSYKATTKEGKVVQGIIEAKDAKDAASFLRSRELFPISLAPKQDNDIFQTFLPFLRRSTDSDIVFFTRQLASMLNAGLTLMQALVILKDQIEKPVMVSTINGIIADVEGGASFSQALTKYPDKFDPIYVSLIQAAESSGLMDKVITRLAENLEKRQELKSTVKGALTYPIIVLIGMGIVMIVMMVFVIPQLSSLYDSLNVALPLPTRIVLGISRSFLILWPFVLVLLVVGSYLFRRWHKTQLGRLIVDKAVLKLPIFGKLAEEVALTEITRTLGLLIGSGSLVVEALRQVSAVSGNVLYRDAMFEVSKRVEKGVTIGSSMTPYSIFPPMLIQMIKIGEQTGKLDETLMRVSEYFQREVDQKIKNLTAALEPLIMLVLGVGVAFLIVSIITPIYNLTNAIK